MKRLIIFIVTWYCKRKCARDDVFVGRDYFDAVCYQRCTQCLSFQ